MGAGVCRRWWSVLLVVALAGCGDPSATGTDTTEPEPDDRPVHSEPFAVGEVPEGYEPVAAGVGSSFQEWGSDTGGTDEPFTVLAPEGSTDPDERVIVATTGFEGYQGELHQALAGYPSAKPTQLTIDGRQALHSPGGDQHPAQLVAVRGDDVAVRVTAAPGTTLEELKAILLAAEVPEDHAHAPRVPSPPDGLEVVGSVDADAVVALRPSVRGDSERMWGLPSMHVAGWLRPAEAPYESWLTVSTLPARAASPEVLPVVEYRYADLGREREWRQVEVGGRPGLVLEEDQGTPGWAQRQVWRWADWGIVVGSSDGFGLLSEAELIELAEGVAPVEGDEWERFVEQMNGGPGLHPDRGRQEVARGTHDGLEWLLQTGPQGGGNYGTGIDPTKFDDADSCLKLSDGRRACVGVTSQGREWVGRGGDNYRGSARVDELVIVSTTQDAASVRITTPVDQVEAPLVPVPGGRSRAAVAFVEGTGLAGCADPSMEPPASIQLMRVDTLDAAGNVVGCVGLDPGG